LNVAESSDHTPGSSDNCRVVIVSTAWGEPAWRKASQSTNVLIALPTNSCCAAFKETASPCPADGRSINLDCGRARQVSEQFRDLLAWRALRPVLCSLRGSCRSHQRRGSRRQAAENKATPRIPSLSESPLAPARQHRVIAGPDMTLPSPRRWVPLCRHEKCRATGLPAGSTETARRSPCCSGRYRRRSR
jgi:hypothetical protein